MLIKILDINDYVVYLAFPEPPTQDNHALRPFDHCGRFRKRCRLHFDRHIALQMQYPTRGDFTALVRFFFTSKPNSICLSQNILLSFPYSPVAQLVEQSTVNRLVVGSNPTGGANF